MNPWDTLDGGGGAMGSMPMTGGQAGFAPPPQPATYSASSYPAYPNDYGLGSQIAPGPTAQPMAAPAAPVVQSASTPAPTASAPDMSSRGFNPWSLTGESNAR